MSPFVLFLFYLLGRGASPAPEKVQPKNVRRARSVQRPSRVERRRPVATAVPTVTTTTAPTVKHAKPVAWPQVVPGDVPEFPGPAWEPDLPPSLAVQSRAAQLLAPLWALGAGSAKIEKTGPRWTAYQATYTGTKRGVVAHRLKSDRPGLVEPSPVPRSPKPAPRPTSPPEAPSSASREGAALLVSTPNKTPIASALKLPVLRKGDRGSDVVTLQKSFGWSRTTDFFGNQTEAEVMKRQRGAGLPATGVVDVATWKVLLGRGIEA